MSATLVYPFSVTIPAGTPKSAPLVTLTQFEPNEVDRIEWVFPNGCNGAVGIQIGARSVPIIPHNSALFIVKSGSESGANLTGMHNTGDWSVIGYNTGAFAHTVTVHFYVHRIQPPEPEVLYFASDAIDTLSGTY